MKKLIKILSILIFVPSIIYALTLSDIRDEVRLQIRDNSTTQTYTDAQLNKRIQIVEQEIAQATYPIYTKQLISPVTGQAEYTISSDTAKIDKVVYLNTSSTTSYKKLNFSTIKSLDADKGIMWENLPSGLPTNYYTRGNIIGFVPAPGSGFCNPNSVKIYYYKKPQGVSSDSDVPFDDIYSLYPYHYLVTLGTTIKCKKDRQMDITADVQMYNTGIAQMKYDVSNEPDRAGTVTVTK